MPTPFENLPAAVTSATQATMSLATNVVTNQVTVLTENPQMLVDRQRTHARQRLEALRNIATAVRTSPMLPALRRLAAEPGAERLEKIIDRLTADLPAVPASGEAIEQPTGDARAYVIVQIETVPRNAPEGFEPVSAVRVNVSTIREDQQIVASLMTRYANNPTYHTALTNLTQYLESFARTDPQSFGYTAFFEQQRQSVTSRGLATMGKLIAVAALGVYALADGVIALSNKKMPLAGLVALGLAGVIGDKRLRQTLLSPRDQIAATEIDAILTNPAFKDKLVPRYELYAKGAQWAPVIEEWLRRLPSLTDFDAKVKKMLPRIPTAEARTKLLSEYASDLGVPAGAIRAHVLTMLTTVAPQMEGTTDFERFITMLGGIRSEAAKEALVALIRTDRGRTLAAGPVLP